MSTHYGRMIHMDDRTVMFGNLEEAAEFIGLTCSRPRWPNRQSRSVRVAVRARPCGRRPVSR